MTDAAPSSSSAATKGRRRGCLPRLLLFGALGFLVVVVGGITLLFFAEGKARKAWAAFKEASVSKGDSLDWREAIPAAVPSPLNFVEHPVFDDPEALENQLDPASLPGVSRRRSGEGDWRQGVSLSLQDVFELDEAGEETPDGGERLRAFLGERQAILSQLSEAMRRPGCRLLFEYETGGFLGEDPSRLVSVCSRAATLYQWRGLEALQRGVAHQVWMDWESIHHLGRHASQGPGLLYGLLSLGCLDLSLQLLWQGLKEQRFEDFQLERMEALLGELALDRNLERQLREERAGFVFLVEECLIGERPLPQAFRQSPQAQWETLQRWVPKAWLYRNLISYCELMDRFGLRLGEAGVDRLDPDALVGLEEALQERRFLGKTRVVDPRHVLSTMATPALERVVEVTLRSQVEVDLARIAIAAERFRLANERFPADLAELEGNEILGGKALPLDRVSGVSYHYRMEARENPVIYGVGLNGLDDGGAVETGSGAGDWVWRYSAE
jgi:hypothetical protein